MRRRRASELRTQRFSVRARATPWRPLVGALFAYAERAYHAERYSRYRAMHEVDPTFGFNGKRIRVLGSPGRLRAGAGSYMDRDCTIHLSGGDVVIGRHVRIAAGVRLDTLSDVAGDRVLDGDRRFTAPPRKVGPVEIGDGVWIGVNVYVGPGVTVGADSVIAANSVVTADVPAGCVAAGTPARPVRSKRNS